VIVTNGASSYEVSKPVAEATSYRLYLCTEAETGQVHLLQIASELRENGGLDRAAYVLRELKRNADKLEGKYALVKAEADKPLSYDLLFPDLVDSFVCQEQGRRRINILAFRGVDDVTSMVPLSNLASRDRLRVDLRTSAWIMGRMLKLLTFVHSEGIAVRTMGGNNILIQPKRHFAVVFDWSSSRIHSEEVPREEREADIANAARAVIAALGGSLQPGAIPDADDESRRYTDYLLRLAGSRESDAKRAHERFYKIVDSLWPRKYHPFTTLPIR
jgi:hypothetical protein